jgi:simple sugar transport system permease protein
MSSERLASARLARLAMAFGSPLAALAITVVIGAALFEALGQSPVRALGMFFVEPLRGAAGLSELAVKATPLAIIGIGLAICFRANVWNIGAEGQYILGAIAATGVALRTDAATGRWVVVVLLLAGALGGMLWAAAVAWLRDRFNTNEILVSLMLVYVAELLLGYLVYGPWKDPEGFNFPQTILFPPATEIPHLFSGYRANVGVLVALALAPLAWLFLTRTAAGFELEVCGIAARAARYAGFSSRRAVWIAFLASGGLAGLAGGLEVAGPLGQLTPHLPVGYGFAAIIVAFVGRLHPFGILLASVLMSMFYIGGDLAQSRLGLPQALTGVFQGLLLFALLACDALAQRWAKARPRAVPAAGADAGADAGTGTGTGVDGGRGVGGALPDPAPLGVGAAEPGLVPAEAVSP